MFVEVASAMQEAVTRVLNVERNHEHVLQNPSCKLNNELHCILSTQPEPGRSASSLLLLDSLQVLRFYIT